MPCGPCGRAQPAHDVARRCALRRTGEAPCQDVRRQFRGVRRRCHTRRSRGGAPGVSDYEAVIGLEIHAQLQTESKIFCGCSAAFGAPPNTHVCPVCLGFPGALPVLNRAAVDHAIRAALALGCRINETSVFARKNYFYPDLPKGYQISQYEQPLASAGVVEFATANGPRQVGITRVHMEEDAGKSLHEGFSDSDRRTYLDYNR